MVETAFDVLNIEYMEDGEETFDYPEQMFVSVETREDDHYTYTKDSIRVKIKSYIRRNFGNDVEVVDFLAFPVGSNIELGQEFEAETFEMQPMDKEAMEHFRRRLKQMREMPQEEKDRRRKLAMKDRDAYLERKRKRKSAKTFEARENKDGTIVLTDNEWNSCIHLFNGNYLWGHLELKLIDDGLKNSAKFKQEKIHSYEALQMIHLYERLLRKRKVRGYPSPNKLFDVEFNEWADQEMMTHGKDISFKDWAEDEGMKHGNTEITEWAQHEDESHDARYDAETDPLWLEKVKHQHYKDMIADLESRNDLTEMDRVRLHHYKDMVKINADEYGAETFNADVKMDDWAWVAYYEYDFENFRQNEDYTKMIPFRDYRKELYGIYLTTKEAKKAFNLLKGGVMGHGDWEDGTIATQVINGWKEIFKGGSMAKTIPVEIKFENVPIRRFGYDTATHTKIRNAETSGQWEIGEQLEEAQMNAEFESLGYSYDDPPDDEDPMPEYYEIYLEDEEWKDMGLTEPESFEDYSTRIKKEYDEMDDYFSRMEKDYERFGLHQGSKRKKRSGLLSDPFDELSLDSGDWKGIVVGFGIGLLGLFGYSKLRK